MYRALGTIAQMQDEELEETISEDGETKPTIRPTNNDKLWSLVILSCVEKKSRQQFVSLGCFYILFVSGEFGIDFLIFHFLFKFPDSPS